MTLVAASVRMFRPARVKNVKTTPDADKPGRADLTAQQIAKRMQKIKPLLAKLRLQEKASKERSDMLSRNFTEAGEMVARPRIDNKRVGKAVLTTAMEDLQKRRHQLRNRIHGLSEEMRRLAEHPNYTGGKVRELKGPRGAEKRDELRADKEMKSKSERKKKAHRRNRAWSLEKRELLLNGGRDSLVDLPPHVVASVKKVANGDGASITTEAREDPAQQTAAERARLQDLAKSWDTDFMAGAERRASQKPLTEAERIQREIDARLDREESYAEAAVALGGRRLVPRKGTRVPFRHPQTAATL